MFLRSLGCQITGLRHWAYIFFTSFPCEIISLFFHNLIFYIYRVLSLKMQILDHMIVSKLFSSVLALCWCPFLNLWNFRLSNNQIALSRCTTLAFYAMFSKFQILNINEFVDFKSTGQMHSILLVYRYLHN